MTKSAADEKKKSVVNAGIAGANSEIVQRYGSAIKEHFVAYSGCNNETGEVLAKGLKGISESKLNPQYVDQNIKQQAGFSAEVKTAARETAEKIIQGNINKTVRTDDMIKQSNGKGNFIGGKNEQIYDIAEVDAHGVYVTGSGRQLKYVGGDARRCVDKILSKKYDKYREADALLEIPADFYDDAQSILSEKAKNTQEQIYKAEQSEKFDLAEKHRNNLKRIEKTQQTLQKGRLTNQEAIEARLHPVISTAKDVGRVSHSAGIESAKAGLAIGGGISFIQNVVSVAKGDKEVTEAVVDFGGDIVKTGTTSYATGFIGSAVKGAMQNAPSTYLQTLSKTNLPATIVVSALEIGKTLERFGKSEIDGVECLIELGEKGTGMLASSAGATLGQLLIPIPVVGGLVGGMIGYAMSTAYYSSVVTALNGAKIAHEDRLMIEAECERAIIAMREYRTQIELAVNNYLRESIAVFQHAFSEMENAYYSGDADKFVDGANAITRQLGGTPLFETKNQFDNLMNNPTIIEL